MPLRKRSRHVASASAVLLACVAAAQTRPGIFRIQPVRPVDELRAAALAAKPPAEPGSFRKSDLVDLAALDPHIKLDIRYATSDNFLSTPVYSSARAFMQRPGAEALLRAHRELATQGYGLLIFDAYRPWYVTRIFWDATPPDKHEFVANPAEEDGVGGEVGGLYVEALQAVENASVDGGLGGQGGGALKGGIERAVGGGGGDGQADRE